MLRDDHRREPRYRPRIAPGSLWCDRPASCIEEGHNRNPSVVDEVLSPDATKVTNGLVRSETKHGPEENKSSIQRFNNAFPDSHMTPESGSSTAFHG